MRRWSGRPTSLPRSAWHPFYTRLNALLAEAQFDALAKAQCAPYCRDDGPPVDSARGVYFRMLLVGYFEGLDAQRAIAWRCSDSVTLREFLGLGMTKPVPEHSSLTVTPAAAAGGVRGRVRADLGARGD